MRESTIKFLAGILSILVCSYSYADQYIVSTKSPIQTHSAAPALKTAAAATLGLRPTEVKSSFSSGESLISIVNITPEQAAHLSSQADTLVEPDASFKLSFTPNDTYYTLQWGYKRIDSERTWNITTGESSSVVAVIDTGIDTTHPDLQGNLWVNPGETPNNGIDDDHNGYIDDVIGYDFGDHDNNPTDVDIHGTHVAGTIAARTNNTKGVAGITFNSRILTLKVAKADGTITLSSILEAMQYAIRLKEAGIDVSTVNMSLGTTSYSRIFEDLMRIAGQRNIMVAAAAGNEAKSNDNSPTFPSQFSTILPNVISVAAINDTGALASFSNYGYTVNLAAPGVHILSTLPVTAQGSYGYLDGTSMASPHVAGVLALMHSVNPKLNSKTLRRVLTDSVRDNADLHGKTGSGGELDAYTSVLNATQAINTFKVSGIVTFNGYPLSGVTIDSNYGSTTTNQGGYYEFSEIPEGTDFTVRASAFGYTFSPSALQGIIDTDKTGDFQAIQALRTINFKLFLDKKPFKSVSVTLSGNGYSKTLKSDKKGKVSFKNVPQGTYTVKFKAKGLKLSNSKASLTVGAEDNITYSVKYRMIR